MVAYKKVEDGTGEKLYSVLNTLIDISEKQQQKHKEHMHMDSLSWSKEYCTIGLRTSRQAGHTYALLEIAMTRFNKSIVISPTIMMNRNIETTIKEQRGKHQTGEIISAAASSLDKIDEIENIDAIFVDCALFLSSNQKEKIYESFKEETKDKPFFFIFVQ